MNRPPYRGLLAGLVDPQDTAAIADQWRELVAAAQRERRYAVEHADNRYRERLAELARLVCSEPAPCGCRRSIDGHLWELPPCPECGDPVIEITDSEEDRDERLAHRFRLALSTRFVMWPCGHDRTRMDLPEGGLVWRAHLNHGHPVHPGVFGPEGAR